MGAAGALTCLVWKTESVSDLPRSANAKARHLEPCRDRTIIFAGNGRSDLDAALAADVVFAKVTLARELCARSLPFHSFDTLQPVLACLRALDEPEL